MNKTVTTAGVIIISVSMLTGGTVGAVGASNSTYDKTPIVQQVNIANTSLGNLEVFDRVAMASAGFKDVNANHWAYGAIQDAVAKGYFKGYSDGTFKPNAVVTREEFGALISRASNNAMNEGGKLQGISGRWSEIELDKAVGQGFINANNYANGFAPQTALTRLEMATWLVNGLSAKFPDYTRAKSDVADGIIPVAEFYKGGLGKPNYGTVAVALGTGLMSGFQDGSFGASQTTTRAEVAVILLRYAAMQEKSPTDFQWLNELREIGLTGTNFLSKNYLYAGNGDKKDSFDKIQNVTFALQGSNGSARISRMIVIDYAHDKDNPLVKMFMGTKTMGPDGQYLPTSSMIVTEIVINPTEKLNWKTYGVAVGKVPGVRGEISTNGPKLYGIPAMPIYIERSKDLYGFFKAGVEKTFWASEGILSHPTGGNDVSRLTITLPSGESLSVIPPRK